MSWIAREGAGSGTAGGGKRRRTPPGRWAIAQPRSSRRVPRVREGAIAGRDRRNARPGFFDRPPRACRVASSPRRGYAPGGRRGRRGLGAGHRVARMAVLPVPLVALVATLRPANGRREPRWGRDGEACICTVCGVVCEIATRARPSSTTTGVSGAANQYQSATRSDWFPEIRCSLRAMHGLFSS